MKSTIAEEVQFEIDGLVCRKVEDIYYNQINYGVNAQITGKDKNLCWDEIRDKVGDELAIWVTIKNYLCLSL